MYTIGLLPAKREALFGLHRRAGAGRGGLGLRREAPEW